MNKAITEGLTLRPTPFSAGLSRWSSGEGTAGSPSYTSAPNAAVVAADADFGTCLEVLKTSGTLRLRHMLETPYLAGMYLRVTARVKVLSGNMPSARISCLPVNGSGAAIGGLVPTADAVALTSYGAVVTVSAIIGSGARAGVDLVWGTAPAGVHVGLDLTGATGGVVRIESLQVEDITSAFHHQMMDWIDVRDYGAIGDGTTNDAAAFAAADAQAVALGKTLLVSAGVFRLGSSLSLAARVRFEGRLSMAAGTRIALTRNYDLESYTAAFGDETEGLTRALQALFHFTDHGVLDLKGRAVNLTRPILIAQNAGIAGNSFVQRRVIDNGQLVAVESPDWAAGVVTSQASFSVGEPYTLSNVANVANIEIGSLVTGLGVARETYVRSKNIGAGTVELSLAPGSQGGTRNYTFTRFRYMLDFSGFGRLDRMEMTNLEFVCNGRASGVMLPVSGITTRFSGCVFNRPKNRGITSIGTGCQGMMIDECQFLSDEMALKVQERQSIGFNVNANDVKIRDNRAMRFRHFAVMHGTGHLFVGNHWFQGDSEVPGVRMAGLVLTGINVKTLVTGNYIDNCYIEMSNERETDPDWNNQFSFGGLSITGNIFTTIGALSSFAWIVIAPRGTGHYIQGISITGNTFRTMNGNVNRIEKVDTTWADLDYTRFRNLTVHGNNYNGVTTGCYNPLVLRHTQNTSSAAWTVNGEALAFGGRARVISAVVADGPIRTATNIVHYGQPYTQAEQGAGGRSAILRWSAAVNGKAWVTMRADSPT